MGTNKATIYIGGLFGYQKIEARNIQHGIMKHAQYLDAVFVKFIPKYSRRTRMWIGDSVPKIIILDEWNHPDPPSAYTSVEGSPNVFMTEISGSPNVDLKFNIFLDDYLARSNVFVKADYREFKPKTTSSLVYSKSLRDRKIGGLISSLLYSKIEMEQ